MSDWSSKQYMRFAKERTQPAADYPDMKFRQLDLSRDNWELDGKFDVVFSNACIQWVSDHERLIPRMMEILADGGELAVQIPMNKSEPIHQIIGELSQSAKWRKVLGSVKVFYTLSAEEYYDILSEISTDWASLKTLFEENFAGHAICCRR